MDMIHTPPSTRPMQSQLDDALRRADELQERLSQVEWERDDRFRELETRVAASEMETARARLEADSMRRVPFSLPFLLHLNSYDWGFQMSKTSLSFWRCVYFIGNVGIMGCIIVVAAVSFLIPPYAQAQYDEEQAVKEKIVTTLHKLDAPNEFSVINLNDLNPIEKRMLLERNFITQNFSVSEDKAIAIYQTGHIFIMINGEDHLRLTCFKGGLALDEAYAEINKIDDYIKTHG